MFTLLLAKKDNFHSIALDKLKIRGKTYLTSLLSAVICDFLIMFAYNTLIVSRRGGEQICWTFSNNSCPASLVKFNYC